MDKKFLTRIKSNKRHKIFKKKLLIVITERNMTSNQDKMLRTIYTNLKNKYASTSVNFAILKMAISDEELKKQYDIHAANHNKKMMSDVFADSGFDLLVPDTTVFQNKMDISTFVDLKVKCEMLYCHVDTNVVVSSGFSIYPRSSISKTPLMLANHTGIIDSGYRGNLIGAFRNLSSDEYTVEKNTRLLQICHPSYCPIFIVFVKENDLSNTERSTGGFGSTGK